MPDPIVFMVMPFNEKETGSTVPGAPTKVDFDALWEYVYQPVLSELGLLTAPSYLLFMFFMITDPQTTTHTRRRRCAVAIMVAVVETGLRLGEVIHAPYYALFVVCPISNLLEIWWDSRLTKFKAASSSTGPAQRTAEVGSKVS